MAESITREVEQHSVASMLSSFTALQASMQLTFAAMQTASNATSLVVADTTKAICKQLEKCETIDELTEVILKLRQATQQ